MMSYLQTMNNFSISFMVNMSNLTISLTNNDTINKNFVEMNFDKKRNHETVGDLELLNHKWQTLLIVLYSLTAALSLIGNIIAIWVLMAGKRSSRELRMFLVNLSLSDITMAVFSIPFTYTDFMLGRWIFMPQFCPIVQFMQLASVFVSVYTLTAIGIDRYIAIIYPLRTTRLTKSFGPIIVLIIWCLASALGFVAWYNSVAEPFEWGNATYYDCKETWTKDSGRLYTCVIFVITFALPMAVLSFTYGSVGWKMFRHSAPGNADLARDEAQQNAKIKVIKMLATIVILFALCWLPLHILNLFIYFAREWLEIIYRTEIGFKSYVALSILAHWLSMANSFVNPIIYCFMSDNFRTDLRILVTKCCPVFKERHRRNKTIRSTSNMSESLHSYRTSVFAMSTKNASNSGLNVNPMRKQSKDNNTERKLNGNSKIKVIIKA